MLLVSIESPWAGQTEEQVHLHRSYAFRAFQHSLARGEAPFASHLFYTTILNDNVPEERELGLTISDQWRKAAHLIAFYVDFGISPGMQRAKELAAKYNKLHVFRTIGKEL